ncbi:fasciclin-like arabinogalactan protein 2 [Lolium perenne]|uniref:fasciclin-like arabinogalactan protein 2 n=1 Tax=Lolium perenne TaxID=4522 RepID=UPI0021EADC8F
MAGLAAPVLIGLLLFASGATAAGDDGAMEIPHVQLPGIADSGLGHGSDAPAPLPPQGQLMDIMFTAGCGSFAALVAATPNVSDVFQQRLVPGGAGAGRLTLFCPDDKAVDSFEPTFRALAQSDRLDVLLHHATVGRYVRAQLAAFDWMAVRTLAANRSQSITLRDDGKTVWLWRSWQGGAAKVIKTVSEEEAPLALAVYLVDAVLLPGYLRQKLDGGYFAWLHMLIPVWVGLCWALSAMVGVIIGFLLMLGAMSRWI